MQISMYFILVCFLSAAIVFTILATRKNMDRRAAKDVLTALILALFALIFFGLSLLIRDERTRLVIHELKFLPLSYLAPCSLMVYCTFTGQPLSLKRKLLLCIIPFISVLLALTNDYYGFFRRGLYTFTHNGVSYIGTESAWGHILYSAYSYVLYIAGIGLLAAHYYKRPRIYRDQIGFMIFTSVLAVLLGLAAALHLFPDYGDISLVACSVVVIVQYITIVNYSRSRVTKKAWNLVVGELDNLVMIFDHKDGLIDANKDASRFAGMLESGGDYLSENSSVDGSVISFPDTSEHFSISEKRLYDKKGGYTGRVLVVMDISDLTNAVGELEYITTHDYLTGLQNRLALRHRLRSLGESDFPAALICVNILGMKLINNVFGYEHGDRVIIRVAKELSAATKGKGHCMRLGGDELGVILKNTSREAAEEFVEGLKAALLGGDELTEINLETNIAVVESTEQNPEQLFIDITENMRKSGALYTMSQGMADSLKKALNTMHDVTGLRARRIKEQCAAAGKRLSLSDEEMKSLELLAEAADIGLLSVSPAVLKQKGDLSNDQWSEWKLHTIKGRSIALSIPELSGIADEVMSHHERFDGYGYPDRLKGEQIPILARIYAAAEFYADAPQDKAAELLKARAGTQFDPAVVAAMTD